jgi:hypothetical protein
MNKKTTKESQEVERGAKSPSGYKNTLDKEEEKRNRRKAMLTKQFNKIKKDPF